MPNINKTALSHKKHLFGTQQNNNKKARKLGQIKNCYFISLACLFDNYIRQQPFALQDRNYQYPARNATLRRRMDILVRNLHREVRLFLSQS